ncbi:MULTISPECIES: hypothetical protein [unclassified Luteococcus]|uniref:hypothetical protein n=1 Tax=unclassified Luteococcus TaxID=2639923 RepID=UPI00313B7BBE
MHRTLGASFLLGALLLPTIPATASHAATPALGPATAWASFAQPDPWVDQTDNLHWYVATPTLDAAATTRPIRFTVNGTSRIDCANLGVSYQLAGRWSSVPVRSRSCTASRAVLEVTPSAAMTGARITLSGWSAVGQSTTATIKGTIALAGTTRTASSTVTRAAAPAPVGPLRSFGTWQGRTLYVASANGVNEIWVGDGAQAIRHPAINGEIWYIKQDGSRVDLWTKDGATLRGWHLDLTTGKTTSQQLASGSISQQGVPGFWLRLDGTGGGIGGEEWLYDWGGTRHATTLAYATRPQRNLGFGETHAFGVTGGQLPNAILVFSLNGMPEELAAVPGTITATQLDSTGVDVTYRQPDGTDTRSCRVEPGWLTCLPPR